MVQYSIPVGIIAVLALIFAWPHDIIVMSGSLITLYGWSAVDSPGLLLSAAAPAMIVSCIAVMGTKTAALPLSISLAVTGVLSIICFVLWELWLGSSYGRSSDMEPLLPLRLWRNRIFIGTSM